MSEVDAGRAPLPGWLPWACFCALALPFHPLWVDFEQVRRGLLLLIAGALLCAPRCLGPIRGLAIGRLFLCAMVASALVELTAQAAFHDAETPWSFQPWEAAYRIAHWSALLVLARAGARSGATAAAVPVAGVLLVTAGLGLLQRLGVAELGGYGVEREPVSTLGNLNVASEWVAVATAATAALLPRVDPRRRWLAIAALVAAGAYLVVNPSRSGKIAATAGLLVLWVMRRRDRGWLPLALAAAGAALGGLLALGSALPQPDGAAMTKELERGTVTLQVRFQIARGATALLAESPLFGKGPGQFQVEYPRHRSQEEIEASSFQRSFRAEVRNAHDDWLELLVDGGVPLVLLFGAMLFALQRGHRDRTCLVPMFVLLLLMFVRAPTLNAPAAALAFWLVGTPATPAAAARPSRRRRAAELVGGALLLLLGLLPVAGNTAFVPYLRAARDGAPPPRAAAEAAAWWMPFEPRWVEVQARAEMQAGDLQRAAYLGARALSLRPFAPPLMLLLAEAIARGGRYGEALAISKEGLQLDPGNPELHQLVSVALAELGDLERAIQEVVVTPHPRLRERLADHFADLAQRADQRAEPQQANRYLIEYLFVALCDRLGDRTPTTLEFVGELNRRLAQETKRFERDATDLRFLYTGALAALDLDKLELADQFVRAASARDARLTPWQRALLDDHLDRLRALPSWQPSLGR